MARNLNRYTIGWWRRRLARDAAGKPGFVEVLPSATVACADVRLAPLRVRLDCLPIAVEVRDATILRAVVEAYCSAV